MDPDEEEEEVFVPDDEEEEIVFDFTGPINPKRRLTARKSKRRELKYIKKVEKLKEYQLLKQLGQLNLELDEDGDVIYNLLDPPVTSDAEI